MRTEGGRESENVEDRRGARRPVMIGGIGTLLLMALVWFLGGNPLALLNQMQQQQQNAPPGQQLPGEAPVENEADAEQRRFVSIVLADTEDVWNEQFERMGRQYREPKLVLFTGQVQSACGFASAAVGPFYCPADQQVYIDLAFFEEMKRKFNSPGDFAQAYVIAHEVGHHVQNLLGISDQVTSMRGRVSQEEFNQNSVRLELQADFLAGVWAHHAQKTRQILEEGDIEEALNAANAIGDDRLQQQGQGYVVPDSFTHGSSEQRVRWFTKGFRSGKIEDGDTFEIAYEDL